MISISIFAAWIKYWKSSEFFEGKHDFKFKREKDLLKL